MTDKKDETLFTVNPSELKDLPAEEIDFSHLEGEETSESNESTESKDESSENESKNDESDGEDEGEGEESDILAEI